MDPEEKKVFEAAFRRMLIRYRQNRINEARENIAPTTRNSNASQSIQTTGGNAVSGSTESQNSDTAVSSSSGGGEGPTIKTEAADNNVQVVQLYGMSDADSIEEIHPFNWHDYAMSNASTMNESSNPNVPAPSTRQMALAHHPMHQPVADMTDSATITSGMAMRATLTMAEPLTQMNSPNYVNVGVEYTLPGPELLFYPCGVCFHLFTDEAEWRAHIDTHPETNRPCQCRNRNRPGPERPIFKRYRKRRFGRRRQDRQGGPE